MDKTNIPTKEITLSDGRIVRYYEWMTQSEEDAYLESMLGDEKVDQDGNVSVGAKNMGVARRYLIEHMLVDFSYEDYDVLPPKDRSLIEDTLGEARGAKKV